MNSIRVIAFEKLLDTKLLHLKTQTPHKKKQTQKNQGNSEVLFLLKTYWSTYKKYSQNYAMKKLDNISKKKKEKKNQRKLKN